jgi:hypothetical protein
MKPQDDPTIARIRETRHRISERFGHDPQKLVAYYIELQKKYQDRLLDASGLESVQAGRKPGGVMREAEATYSINGKGIGATVETLKFRYSASQVWARPAQSVASSAIGQTAITTQDVIPRAEVRR